MVQLSINVHRTFYVHPSIVLQYGLDVLHIQTIRVETWHQPQICSVQQSCHQVIDTIIKY